MTWSLWISVALVYLISAVILITYSLFSKTGPLSRIGTLLYLKPRISKAQSNSTDVDVTLAMMLARRDIARQALTVRVLGYISVPVVCVFPGVIMDFIARGRPDVYIPPAVPLITAVTAGLMGTFNAILLSFDPSVVAVVFWPHWKKKTGQGRLRQNMKSEPQASTCRPAALEMAETQVVGDETQGLAVTTAHFQNAGDQDLESRGHSKTASLENSRTSATGDNIRDLVETYHGL
jgi:hypothetical protein